VAGRRADRLLQIGVALNENLDSTVLHINTLAYVSRQCEVCARPARQHRMSDLQTPWARVTATQHLMGSKPHEMRGRRTIKLSVSVASMNSSTSGSAA
jgi:hypothetical protein